MRSEGLPLSPDAIVIALFIGNDVRFYDSRSKRVETGLASWFDLRGDLRGTVVALAETFHCRTVCVTRGRNGAALWRDGRWTEHAGFEVEVRDTIGAGDAFLAVLLAGLLKGTEDEALLHHANLIGAYVVTQHGAVPEDQPLLGQLPATR